MPRKIPFIIKKLDFKVVRPGYSHNTANAVFFAYFDIELSFFWKNAANSVKTLSLIVQMRKFQVSERFYVNVSGFLVTIFALVF